jgi:hypothetical protein
MPNQIFTVSPAVAFLNYMTISELCHTFAEFSRGFLYISLISPEGSAKLLLEGVAQRPVFRGKEPKNTGARSAKTH